MTFGDAAGALGNLNVENSLKGLLACCVPRILVSLRNPRARADSRARSCTVKPAYLHLRYEAASSIRPLYNVRLKRASLVHRFVAKQP